MSCADSKPHQNTQEPQLLDVALPRGRRVHRPGPLEGPCVFPAIRSGAQHRRHRNGEFLAHRVYRSPAVGAILGLNWVRVGVAIGAGVGKPMGAIEPMIDQACSAAMRAMMRVGGVYIM